MSELASNFTATLSNLLPTIDLCIKENFVFPWPDLAEVKGDI